MLQFEELKLRLIAHEEELSNLAEALGLEKMKSEIATLEEQQAQEGFWDDIQNSQKVLQRTSVLKNKVSAYEKLKTDYEDALVMIELADEEEDESLVEECTLGVDKFEKDLDSQTLATLLTGEYDSKNAILTFHAGAGGTEAQDWAQMLFRMYNRWGERHGYKVSTLDYLDGDEAGLKSACILIEGENAYGYLKAEKGVHRLVRISPFDASGRRHTSFASLDVLPELDDDVTVLIKFRLIPKGFCERDLRTRSFLDNYVDRQSKLALFLSTKYKKVYLLMGTLGDKLMEIEDINVLKKVETE